MQVCGKDLIVNGRLIRIARIDGEGYQFLTDPAAALRDLVHLDLRVDVLTFTQPLSQPVPQYPYLVEWDNMAVLPVSTFEHWLRSQLDRKGRNLLRKAEKSGVVVKEVPLDDSLVRGISAIFNETPIRRGKPFPHFGKDLDTVRRLNATFSDQSVFIGAFHDGHLIGYIKLVSADDRSQAGIMQIMSLISHRHLSPNNALIAQAVRACAERSIPYLWYAKFSYGRSQHDGLMQFKQQNGFHHHDVPRFYVPLTMAGRLALRLGWHRSVSQRIPAPLADALRELRRRWYLRKTAVPLSRAS